MDIHSLILPRQYRQHLKISWNSSNEIFRSFALLTVHLGDSLNFICPHYTDDSHSSYEYNTIYLVSEHDYYSCNTTNYYPLTKCNKPFDPQPLIYTLSISKYLPYPNLPEFTDGRFYYFISTSSGRFNGIDQRIGGLCSENNMKLIVHVQKHSRFYRLTPIKAKRMNYTYIHLNQRYSSFSSSVIPSRNRHMILFLVCILFINKQMKF